MRLACITAVYCLGLALWAVQPATAQSAAPAADASASSNQSDAAEKHAKRTACLKEAKDKKLVGAQKTAYLKDCIASDGHDLTTSTTPAAPG
jgi:hypothetical protein